MSFCTALEYLRHTLWLNGLPDSIAVPNGAGQKIVKNVVDATVDDVALAAHCLARELTGLSRTVDALRQIHDLARSAGATGGANAVAAAASAAEHALERPQARA